MCKISGRKRHTGLKIVFGIILLLFIEVGMWIYFSFYLPHPEITLPDLIGKPIKQDMKTLKKLKLNNVIVENEPSLNQPKGTVIYSDPEADTPIMSNTPVKLEISSGNVAKMANYKGQEISDVIFDLTKNIGMKKEQITVKKISGSSKSINTVIRQSTLTTNFDYSSQKIVFYISDGKKKVKISNYVNQNFSNVQSHLIENGISDNQLSITYRESNTIAIGNIIKNDNVNHSIVPGSSSKINFVISSGSAVKTKVMPSVIGMSKGDAQKALEAIGFSANNISFGGVLDTTVESQSIDANTLIIPNKTFVSLNMTAPVSHEKAIDQIDVTTLQGLELTQTTDQLQQLGIDYKVEDETTTDDQEDNKVKNAIVNADTVNIVVYQYVAPAPEKTPTQSSSTTQNSSSSSTSSSSSSSSNTKK
ncbi:PASTA domain-containing protein [Lactococcus lactis]|uniref:PASTA domain-containing protein n=1 Tax=Lactococcus lactis TaxID=1358 RepID=UPI00288E3863|nr:PASTA domain-containing protein [Lactococcus lactis]MDT2938596.1 PASTA domain-containing protein [Lactococcus lactis]